ncbi:hypothetical protein [Aneurinibacillus terranovensis]|uniref:hypothetical protein n=1 Tax=Aneurinibacillus terranovensis TaxID=278991 RepID=UPI000412AB99|nr:hypothetical protein [Aneurinibacillus terranovensis]
MEVHEHLFSGYLKAYALEVEKIENVEDGWVALTDRGAKRIIYCPDKELFQWSHTWRENLVRRGFRYVERYLATKEDEHWIEDRIGIYALSDYWPPMTQWPEDREIRLKGYESFGQILASIHADSCLVDYRGRYRAEGTIGPEKFTNAYQWLQTIMKEKKEGVRWIHNLPHVTERVQKAEELYLASKARGDTQRLSFAFVQCSQLVYWEGEWYVTGLHNPVLGPLHEDTVSLLEQIFQAENGQADALHAFLGGYTSVREWPEAEWKYVSALLCYPGRLLQQMLAILGGYRAEEDDFVQRQFKLQMEREKILHEIALWNEQRGRSVNGKTGKTPSV